jgi:hypothetical protein
MSNLIDSVTQFFESFDLLETRIAHDLNSVICATSVKISNQESRLYVRVEEGAEHSTLDVSLILPITCTNETQVQTALLVNSINSEIGQNIFVMDKVRDNIKAKLSFPCAGLQVTDLFFSYLLGNVCKSASDWYDAFLKVACYGEPAGLVFDYELDKRKRTCIGGHVSQSSGVLYGHG